MEEPITAELHCEMRAHTSASRGGGLDSSKEGGSAVSGVKVGAGKGVTAVSGLQACAASSALLASSWWMRSARAGTLHAQLAPAINMQGAAAWRCL